MSTIGILFDIEALGGGLYGYEAYKALFETIDTRLFPSSTLADGDTAATLTGGDNHYCIAVTCGDPSAIARVRDAVARAQAAGALPAFVRFIDGDAVAREPLVPAAAIDAAGTLVSAKPRWIREAWETARHARTGSGTADAADSGGSAGNAAESSKGTAGIAAKAPQSATTSSSAKSAPAAAAAAGAARSATDAAGRATTVSRNLPFAALFDIPRFGLNVTVGLGLVLASVIAEFSWVIPALARGSSIGFNPMGYYLVNFSLHVLEAALFVAVVHRVHRTAPLVALWSGLTLVRGVLWRAVFTLFPVLPGGRLGMGIFEPALLLRSLVYGALFMLALILAVRTWKVTLKAFLAGGVAATLLPTVLVSWSMFRSPGGFPWTTVVLIVANGLVMGGLLYAGLLRHYHVRGIVLSTDRSFLSTYYYICSTNRSLIHAFAEIFSVAAAAGWGSARPCRLSLSDGRVAAARQLASAQNQPFEGTQFIGEDRVRVARMDDLLDRLQAGGDSELHVLFAEMTDAHAAWVHEAYNTLLQDAATQGILPFRMYATKSPAANRVLQGLLTSL
ncbi:MAG: hypothetical protein Q8K55_08085 [Gemmatimonadaceae bacterium]|nr:hypothetical protein [Gemmatimonadaceae bacterium]